MTMGLASMMLQSPAATIDTMGPDDPVNPLLQKSTLPFGAPDFSKIKTSDYLPAIQTAIQQQREEIDAILANKKKPTFENTILALEKSGVLLDRVTSIFFGLVSADKTSEIAEIERKVMPMLTELENDIAFNPELFQRITINLVKVVQSTLLLVK